MEKNKIKILSENTYETLSSFYSLFADKTRLAIISLLIDNKLCVNEIAEILSLEQSRVSHQLAILRKHDIVIFIRSGKQVLYSLKDNHIKDIFKTGLEHVSEKDEKVYSERKEYEH